MEKKQLRINQSEIKCLSNCQNKQETIINEALELRWRRNELSLYNSVDSTEGHGRFRVRTNCFCEHNSGSHNRIEIASEIANKRNLVSLGL